MRTRTFFMAVLLAAALVTTAPAEKADSFGGPEGFIAPPLHPAGVVLQTRKLGDGVYALLSGGPVDNSGFIVGESGVLVIDAHINGRMARQIQKAVREVTDKPILYLVNTNYHGDHTFGNYAFPATTQIVAQRQTARLLANFEHEKQFLLATVNNDKDFFAGIELRLPDIVFDRFLRVDLGGRQVEIHHFGAGNTPGDTVVYEPATGTAWTGNLILGEGLIPFLIEGGVWRYAETVRRFAKTLDVKTIIPGHAAPVGTEIFELYLSYLNDLLDSVQACIEAGKSLQDTLASTPLAVEYLPPEDSPLAPFVKGLHLWNVQKTYIEEAGH